MILDTLVWPGIVVSMSLVILAVGILITALLLWFDEAGWQL